MMVVCHNKISDVKIVVNEQVLEQVKKFNGVQTMEDANESKRNCQRNIYKDERCVDIMEIVLEIRKHLVRCYVLSICLYASESWTLMSRWRIKPMLLRCGFFQDMFRILHLDRKTNVELLDMAKMKQTLLKTIQERKLQYFGHLIREKGSKNY